MLCANGPAPAMIAADASNRNQTGTSWLLAMSPFLRASSSLRWVGSSVFWLLSCSSAMSARREDVRLALHLLQPDRNAAAQTQRNHCDAEKDRERHGDQEDLDLR